MGYKVIFECTVRASGGRPDEVEWTRAVARAFGADAIVKATISGESECKLNSIGFGTGPKSPKPGFCFGMAIDWAKTSLKYDGVRYKNMLTPGTWPLVQTAYEVNLGAGRDTGYEETVIASNGLKVTNGGGDGEEVPFNHDFAELATKLASKVGTHIIILRGLPGKGAHFIAFRRIGVANFVTAEFFDPNDASIKFDSEQEFTEYVGGYLTWAYTGTDGKPDFSHFCGMCTVTL